MNRSEPDICGFCGYSADGPVDLHVHNRDDCPGIGHLGLSPGRKEYVATKDGGIVRVR